MKMGGGGECKLRLLLAQEKEVACGALRNSKPMKYHRRHSKRKYHLH